MSWRASRWRESAPRPEIVSRTVDRYGIADERAFYARITGWRQARPGVPWPDPATAAMAAELQRDWTADPFWDLLAETGILAADDSLPAAAEEAVQSGRARPVVVRAAIGTLGFDIGPRFHVLDLYALADPLRARMPALERDPLMPHFSTRVTVAHRPGHYMRRIPPGYVATLVTGTNALRDADLASFWEDVRRVTRGSLWAADRWGAIWRLQLGARDARIRRWAERDVETR
jgi:arabinofuranosyltransferase